MTSLRTQVEEAVEKNEQHGGRTGLFFSTPELELLLSALDAVEWRTMDSAPRDGTPFLALNHDGEIWLAKYVDGDRLTFRTNRRCEPRKFSLRQIDGETWMKEDVEFAKAHEKWSSEWTFWSRLYEFKPTHWRPLGPTPEGPA